MNIHLNTLNDNQKNAVTWQGGPLLVLAGPGSGKTQVLTLRAAKILEEHEDTSVLALTFTTKAADEMRERLDYVWGGRADRAHLCTFHSFAGDILRQHGSHLGIRPDYSVLTQDEDRIATLERVIEHLPDDSSTIPSDRRNLLTMVDRLFAESYDSEPTTPALASTPSWVPSLFETYCNALKDSSRLDYGALLHFARRLLKEHPAVTRMLRLGWTHVCVDEFQDTNRAQYDLLRLIVGGGSPNLFVVADDDQIIYQWNGASPERLHALRKDYDMEVIQLPQNYRCPGIIISMANNLIQHNQMRTANKAPLVAQRMDEKAGVVFANTFPDEAQESSAVPQMIKERRLVATDCVVLGRSTKILERVAHALQENGFLPFLAKRKNEFESGPISWLHSMLRLANARHDREFVRRACVAWQSMAETCIEVATVDASSALHGGDFFRAWLEVSENREKDDSCLTFLRQVRNHLADRLEFISLLDWFWTQPCWPDDDLVVEEMNTWKEIHGALLREHGQENITLNLYLQEMDLKSKAPNRPPDAIPCLTIHGAKGLEFKHVFLVGMAEEVFPSYHAVRKGDQSREMEEERRSCFVGITRVQETLTITWAQSYNGWPKKPSRFLREMGFRNV